MAEAASSLLPAYRAPRWLPDGHSQTIWPALFARRSASVPPRYRRERWETPDADFIDVTGDQHHRRTRFGERCV